MICMGVRLRPLIVRPRPEPDMADTDLHSTEA
jgi:hypothetical protein